MRSKREHHVINVWIGLNQEAKLVVGLEQRLPGECDVRGAWPVRGVQTASRMRVATDRKFKGPFVA